MKLYPTPASLSVRVCTQTYVQVLTLAFLVVGATCVAMIPLMLEVLSLKQYGWNWLHACMFGAMIASTDAVAIVAVMKTGKPGPPPSITPTHLARLCVFVCLCAPP